MDENAKGMEIELDFKRFFEKLLSLKFFVVAIIILCTLLAYLYSALFLKPTYSSYSQLHLMNVKSEGVNTNEISSFSSLSNDFVVMIGGRRILSNAISAVKKDLSKEYSVGELSSMLDVRRVDQTRLISISVTAGNARDAQLLSNAISSVACDTFNERYKMEIIYISETSENVGTLSGPNVFKNSIIGFGVGLVFSFVLVLILTYTDDAIKTGNDVERYLSISTLAVIPYTEDKSRSKKSKKKVRK